MVVGNVWIGRPGRFTKPDPRGGCEKSGFPFTFDYALSFPLKMNPWLHPTQACFPSQCWPSFIKHGSELHAILLLTVLSENCCPAGGPGNSPGPIICLAQIHPCKHTKFIQYFNFLILVVIESWVLEQYGSIVERVISPTTEQCSFHINGTRYFR